MKPSGVGTCQSFGFHGGTLAWTSHYFQLMVKIDPKRIRERVQRGACVPELGRRRRTQIQILPSSARVYSL